MNKPKSEAVIRTLLEIGAYHGKGYAFPSQKKILKLSRKWSHIKMSRRTLNRVLKELENDGWFDRVRRHREGPDGKIVFASTLYKFKARCFSYVDGLGKFANRFFSRFRVPKVSQYNLKAEGCIDSAPSASVLAGEGLSKGGAGGPASGLNLLASEPVKAFFKFIKGL